MNNAVSVYNLWVIAMVALVIIGGGLAWALDDAEDQEAEASDSDDYECCAECCAMTRE